MWYIKFRCGCAVKSNKKTTLPKRCPYHCTTGPIIWEEPSNPCEETNIALNKLKELKETQSKIAKEKKIIYHKRWLTHNRNYWNEYQRNWREKKRGYPIINLFYPKGIIKKLADEHKVTINTIYKWIKINKLKIEKIPTQNSFIKE
jgi:hypothetical protein